MRKLKPTLDWDDLSHPQVLALSKLYYSIPVHQTYAMKILKIAGSTLYSLEKRGLIRKLYLAQVQPSTSMSVEMPFLTITQEGERLVRRWNSWNRRAHEVASQVRRTRHPMWRQP